MQGFWAFTASAPANVMKLLDTLSDDLTRFAVRETLAHLVRLERQAVLRERGVGVNKSSRWHLAGRNLANIKKEG
jgi:hypothetical protein